MAWIRFAERLDEAADSPRAVEGPERVRRTLEGVQRALESTLLRLSEHIEVVDATTGGAAR